MIKVLRIIVESNAPPKSHPALEKEQGFPISPQCDAVFDVITFLPSFLDRQMFIFQKRGTFVRRKEKLPTVLLECAVVE